MDKREKVYITFHNGKDGDRFEVMKQLIEYALPQVVVIYWDRKIEKGPPNPLSSY